MLPFTQFRIVLGYRDGSIVASEAEIAAAKLLAQAAVQAELALEKQQKKTGDAAKVSGIAGETEEVAVRAAKAAKGQK